MYTTKIIIENQKKYKEEIIKYLNKDLVEYKKKLYDISCEDDYINSEIEKIKKRFTKKIYKKEIERLFFLHPNRNVDFYIWWDFENKEALILNYGKK